MKLDLTQAVASIRQHHKLPADAKVKFLNCCTVKAMPNDPYRFTARITTDSVDRQNEVVIPQGGDVKEFMQGGIISWNHDYSTPVGFPDRSTKAVRTDTSIDISASFMKRPDDFKGDFFPDMARAFVTQAVAAGLNPGVSIGFLPIESRRPTQKDIQRWGDKVAYVHSSWKLLEVAIAPVQANQDAVVLAVGKGLLSRELAVGVGYDVPEVAAPPPSAPKVIHGSMVMVDDRLNMGEEVERQLKRMFGKIY